MNALDKKDLLNLKKMANFMRSQRIKRMKLGEIEIELDPSVQKPLSPYLQKKISRDNGVEDGDISPIKYNDEDVLFWSSTQIPPHRDEE